jgi:hypothetical protein
MPDFYSYLWLREDGTPYYAGKGSGRRAFRSIGHSVHRPVDRSHIVVFPMLNEAEAFESEIALIELFGRKDNGTGVLRNMTDGGEGVRGHKRTEEHNKRISIALIGHTVTPTPAMTAHWFKPGHTFGKLGWTPERRAEQAQRNRDNKWSLGKGKTKKVA